MAIEDSIKDRLRQLLAEAPSLARGNKNDQCVDPAQMAACSAWITAAQNVVHLIVSSSDAPYRQKADGIARRGVDFVVHHSVSEFASVLKSLLLDSDMGLLASVADNARAEAFDDFLDHAVEYLRLSRKQESGVIAGVVFEDSLRRICRKRGIEEKGKKLDALISALATKGDLTPVKAKRARASADIRTKATHAQWDEFELDDVRATVEFTRELIDSKLA